ncbi:t-SNARE complex subunit, syntaxin [Catovirus CTV1]|uniref:t-SNARE complex subunit, syntaxin n=1 Tax=Catovirus CTV1 TaxID=1977631 RepID=A0A1V0SBQ8_9VIRU|nr:t-SNARE complex subunit, syntaxin [Catovirus CTV1]
MSLNWNDNHRKATHILSSLDKVLNELDPLFTQYLTPSFKKTNKEEIRNKINEKVNIMKSQCYVAKKLIDDIEIFYKVRSNYPDYVLAMRAVAILRSNLQEQFKKIVDKNKKFMDKCEQRENLIKDFNYDLHLAFKEDDQNDTPQDSLMKEYDFEREIEIRENIINSRGKEIREITNEIMDLHDLMKEFNEFVNIQGHSIDLIEQNIDKTNDNIDSANDNLEVAAEHQTRGNACQILIVIIVGIIIITIILAVIIYLKVMRII